MENTPLLTDSMPSYDYWAFISYSSKDRAWAEWLHSALENYRLPVQFLEHPTSMGDPAPKRLRPLFWDRAEMTAHHDLGELIERSLRASRFLIVICSPHAAQSPWVEKEIQAFQRMHGQERILALIVGGEPNAPDTANCFPPTLRAREPKAPDARPGGDGKTHAKLMLLATMLGVSFDSLKRRDQVRKRKLVLTSLIAGLVMLICAGWLLWDAASARSAENQARIQAETRLLELAEKAFAEWQDSTDQRTRYAKLAESLRHNSQLPEQKQLRDLNSSMVNEAFSYWDAEPLPLMKPLQPKSGGELGTMFSPDGSRVLTANHEGAQLWDASTGTPVGEPLQCEGAVGRAIFSPDGKRILTYGRNACLWDSSTGQPVGRVMEDSGGMKSASFSPDGKCIATVGRDGAHLWDAMTGERVGTVAAPDSSGMKFANFSADSRLLLTADESTAWVWDVETRTLVGKAMAHEKQIQSASISPDGSKVITTSNSEAQLWFALTGDPVTSPIQHQHKVTLSAFSPDGELFLTAGGDVAQLWDSYTHEPVGEPMTHAGHPLTGSGIASAQFSADGLMLVTSGYDGTAKLWNAHTGQAIGSPFWHTGYVYNASFSPDGRLVATGGEGEVILWQVHAAPASGTIPLRHAGVLNGACISPDKLRVATFSESEFARLWDASTGRPIGHTLTHHSLAGSWFSPSGRRLTTVGEGGVILVWDAHTGARFHEISVPQKWMIRSRFSPDEQYLVTSTVTEYFVWDVKKFDCVWAEGSPDAPLFGDVEFSPDSRSLFVQRLYDDTILEHDLKTGKLIETKRGKGLDLPLSDTSKQELPYEGTSIRLREPPPSGAVAKFEDLVNLAGLRSSPGGEIEELSQADRLAWREQLLRSSVADDDVWRRLLRWKVSNGPTRSLTFNGKVSVEELIEREVTWAMSHLEATRRDDPDGASCFAVLDDAYLLDPGSPLIHLAMMAADQQYAFRQRLIDHGLRQLSAAEAQADKAPHQAHAGTYRAKAAVILWLQDEKLRARETFAVLLRKHDPKRETWGSEAWLRELDHFDWPESFTNTLVELINQSKE